MLGNSINLPGSRDVSGGKRCCSRCGNDRHQNDGISFGSRFVCGKCWRNKASRPEGAVAALAKEGKVK